MFRSFLGGTFKAPPQFSNQSVWHSAKDFRNSLLNLDTERWNRILASLNCVEDGVYPAQAQGGFRDLDLDQLSAFQVDLMDFSSPMRG